MQRCLAIRSPGRATCVVGLPTYQQRMPRSFSIGWHAPSGGVKQQCVKSRAKDGVKYNRLRRKFISYALARLSFRSAKPDEHHRVRIACTRLIRFIMIAIQGVAWPIDGWRDKKRSDYIDVYLYGHTACTLKAGAQIKLMGVGHCDIRSPPQLI